MDSGAAAAASRNANARFCRAALAAERQRSRDRGPSWHALENHLALLVPLLRSRVRQILPRLAAPAEDGRSRPGAGNQSHRSGQGRIAIQESPRLRRDDNCRGKCGGQKLGIDVAKSAARNRELDRHPRPRRRCARTIAASRRSATAISIMEAATVNPSTLPARALRKIGWMILGFWRNHVRNRHHVYSRPASLEQVNLPPGMIIERIDSMAAAAPWLNTIRTRRSEHHIDLMQRELADHGVMWM